MRNATPEEAVRFRLEDLQREAKENEFGEEPRVALTEIASASVELHMVDGTTIRLEFDSSDEAALKGHASIRAEVLDTTPSGAEWAEYRTTGRRMASLVLDGDISDVERIPPEV